MKRRWVFISLVLLLILSACTNEPNQKVREVNADAVFSTEDFTNKLQVRFFHLEHEDNLKTGESILITTPEGKNILIDAGISEVGPLIDDYLTRLGIEHIDIVMPSHPHSDHIGGLLTLFETKEIGKIVSTSFPYTSSEIFQAYEHLIDEKNLQVEYVEKGDVLELEEDLKLEILNPSNETIDKYLDMFDTFSAGIVNDLSMVVKMTYKDNTFLFTGDIYTAVESQLVDEYGEQLSVDVVVAPHHGQHTSSSKKFLETVKPEVSVIPTNVLFSRTTYEDYIEVSGDVYVSQFDGNVLIVSDGKSISVYSEKENEDVIEVSK